MILNINKEEVGRPKISHACDRKWAIYQYVCHYPRKHQQNKIESKQHQKRSKEGSIRGRRTKVKSRFCGNRRDQAGSLESKGLSVFVTRFL
ncbi:hypothetical protein Hanom_Chr02g00135631 [Helianthus anomalus]